MLRTQNETRVTSCELRVASSLDTPVALPRISRLAPRAFTLTELLVVITIIAILAGLITGAALNALKKAKQAAITLELQQLGNAMEDLKNELGSYPPNGMNPAAGPPAFLNNALGNPIAPIVQSDFQRMFKKAFPRSQEPPALIDALAGANAAGPGPNLLNGMSAEEALVFWRGGFIKYPQFPITGPGGPAFVENPNDSDTVLRGDDEILEGRDRSYEFDLGRFVPRDAIGVFHGTDNGGNGRFILYTAGGIERRINFWRYVPSGSQQPMVYFDVSRHLPQEYDVNAAGVQGAMPMIHALEKHREGLSGVPGIADLVYINQGKFQVLHAGTDDFWGTFAPLSLTMQLMQGNNASDILVPPTGPFIGDIADTLGNFMTGTLEDEQE